MKVTFVQYAGDYREAYQRLASGGAETYQAQRYSVEFMGSLPHQVTVVCGVTPEPYNVLLSNGVRAIGAGLTTGFDDKALIPLLGETDRLIMTTPVPNVLDWANRREIRTLLMIADSYPAGGLKQKIKNRLAARRLNRVEWIGNHQGPASRSLQRMGVNPRKIVPWDWPPSHRPDAYVPRELHDGPLRLAYFGAITQAKGASDLIRALPDGVTLDMYGPIVDEMPKRPNVAFKGIIPNSEVPSAMQKVDAVVVPSRHEYPEGLPLVILESFATRTPLIASDHPMFDFGEYAVRFKAGSLLSLRSAIERLGTNAQLYRELSLKSAEVWKSFQIPVTFGEMVTRWLDDDTAWLAKNALRPS